MRVAAVAVRSLLRHGHAHLFSGALAPTFLCPGGPRLARCRAQFKYGDMRMCCMSFGCIRAACLAICFEVVLGFPDGYTRADKYSSKW